MKDLITTITEVLGVGLILVGVYMLFKMAVTLIVTGVFLIAGSYIYINRWVFLKENNVVQKMEILVIY